MSNKSKQDDDLSLSSFFKEFMEVSGPDKMKVSALYGAIGAGAAVVGLPVAAVMGSTVILLAPALPVAAGGLFGAVTAAASPVGLVMGAIQTIHDKFNPPAQPYPNHFFGKKSAPMLAGPNIAATRVKEDRSDGEKLWEAPARQFNYP